MKPGRGVAGRGRLGERLAAGCDAVVLEDLYDAYGAGCYRLAHHVVADPDVACTVVRDVFLGVWAGTAVFDPERGSVETWLLRSTHRFAIDAVRRSAPLSRPGGLAMQVRATVDAEAEQEGWATNRRAVVLAAMTKLNDAQRRILEMAFVGGKTQSEIAVLTGTAVSTVKWETAGALRRLHEDLAWSEPVVPA